MNDELVSSVHHPLNCAQQDIARIILKIAENISSKFFSLAFIKFFKAYLDPTENCERNLESWQTTLSVQLVREVAWLANKFLFGKNFIAKLIHCVNRLIYHDFGKKKWQLNTEYNHLNRLRNNPLLIVFFFHFANPLALNFNFKINSPEKLIKKRSSVSEVFTHE